MLKTAYFWGGLVFGAVLYLAAANIQVPVVTVVWAMLSGVLAVFFLQVFTLYDDDDAGASPLWAVALAGGCAFAGSLVKALIDRGQTLAWDTAGMVVSAAAAYGFVALRSATRKQACSSCRSPVSTQESFVCPRCGQVMCSRLTCWSARHLRCTLCLEREVILFPTAAAWWNEQLGPPVEQGACDSCYKEAGETVLRACGQCPLVMCHRCWDYHNGRCLRCDWHVRELPRALWPLVRSTPRRPGQRSRGHGRERPAPDARRRVR